jgi:hypothetical protein
VFEFLPPVSTPAWAGCFSHSERLSSGVDTRSWPTMAKRDRESNGDGGEGTQGGGECTFTRHQREQTMPLLPDVNDSTRTWCVSGSQYTSIQSSWLSACC